MITASSIYWRLSIDIGSLTWIWLSKSAFLVKHSCRQVVYDDFKVYFLLLLCFLVNDLRFATTRSLQLFKDVTVTVDLSGYQASFASIYNTQCTDQKRMHDASLLVHGLVLPYLYGTVQVQVTVLPERA